MEMREIYYVQENHVLLKLDLIVGRVLGVQLAVNLLVQLSKYLGTELNTDF